MSDISTTITYSTPGNFVFDAGKIGVSGGKAQLIRPQSSQTFNETFTADTGFTYNSAQVEFAGGQAIHKKPANATAFVHFGLGSKDLTFGDGTLTGTLNNGAAVTGGYLDLKGGSAEKYLEFSATANADSNTAGCVRIVYRPNYSGTPASNQVLFSVWQASGANNRIEIYHNWVNGNLYMIGTNSAGGTAINSPFGVFSPTAGTDYEIELNWDIASGATRLFVNGVQLGSTLTTTYTRSAASITRLLIGNAPSPYKTPDFEVKSFFYFSTVQHTANYTPDATIYPESAVTLPTFTHTTGTVIAGLSFAATETAVPRYTLSVDGGSHLYWTGSAWAVSNGTYAQASTEADVSSNIATLTGIAGSTTLVVKAIFPASENTRTALDDLTVTYTGEEAFATDNPTIKPATTLDVDGVTSFSHVFSAGGNDNVRYTVELSGSEYWWTGAAWAVANGTYAQTNVAADINTNVGTLPLTGGKKLRFVAWLHSDDGSTTPDLTSISFNYDFFAFFSEASTLSECVVYGWVRDTQGDGVSGATVSVFNNGFEHGDHWIDPVVKSTTTDSNGYWELQLVESASVSQTPYLFTVNGFQHPAASVPNQLSAKFTDLVVPK